MDTQNKEKIGGNPKQLKLILGVVLLIIIAVVIVVLTSKKSAAPTTENNQPVTEQTGTETTEVAEASTPINSEELIPVEVPNIKGAKVVVEGANAITTDNVVVTETGKVTDNVALPMSENAPKQTGFLNKEELAPSVLKLSVGNNKFTPSEFTTKAGAPTTFAITGVDDFSHVIAFDDPILSAIAVLVGPAQTKAITFNAPTTPGTYTFRCASPNHAEAGEIGKMTVK